MEHSLFRSMADPPVSEPEIALNHFYVVLASTTFRAVEHDAFQRRQFAANEKRTTMPIEPISSFETTTQAMLEALPSRDSKAS